MIKKFNNITKWKQDTLRHGIIAAKEIDQWEQILNECEASLKEIATPKTKRR